MRMLDFDELYGIYKDSIIKDKQCVYCGYNTIIKRKCRIVYEEYTPASYYCIYCGFNYSAEKEYSHEQLLNIAMDRYYYCKNSYCKKMSEAKMFKRIMDKVSMPLIRRLVVEEL